MNSPVPVLDSRTQTLYSAKRDSTYKSRDLDKTITTTAFFLCVVMAAPALLVVAGILSPDVARPLAQWLAWAWTTLGFTYAIVVFSAGALTLFAALAWLVHQVRHRHDRLDVLALPITQPTCTFFASDFVLGQGWTVDGLQPGGFIPASRPRSDFLKEPNLFIRGDGVFQNTKLEGAPGTGKSKLMESLIAQAVRKYPMPPPLPRTSSGQWFQIPPWDTDESESLLVFMETERARFLALEARVPRIVLGIVKRWIAVVREWRERRRGGMPFLTAATDPVIAAAYGGIGAEGEAEARRAELIERHRRRPTVFVVNAKPESYGQSLVDIVVRAAAADSAERSAQVYIVSPDLGTSVSLFELARTNADLASTIATTINIIEGETDRFWTGQMTSLVSCLVGVMKTMMPGRINWLTLLDLLRTKERFDRFVADAKALFEAQGEAARRNEPPEGRAINHVELSEIERFSQLDPRKFVETTAHILNFGGKLTAGDLGRTMAPEVPTFGTMDQVVREGGLLCIDMPLSRYQDVSRAAVTMLINAFVAAVMEVARKTRAGEMRESYLFIDEAASFMTPVLERALSQNRSAKLGVFLAFQIRTQFEASNTTAGKTLGTTCANSISFRDPDGLSADLKSRSYGTHEMLVEDYGLSESLGRVQGAAAGAWKAAGSRNRGRCGRPYATCRASSPRSFSRCRRARR